MKKAISAQNTRMYLENPDAPAIATGVVRAASRSQPCVCVFDSVSGLMNGEAVLITGTDWTTIDDQTWVMQNIDEETNAVTLANSNTTDEQADFDTANARFTVHAYIDVCAVAYQINQNPAAEVDTTNLCDTEKTSVAGFTDPGTLTFDFFIDPTDPDYQALLDAQEDGEVRWFIIVYRNNAVRSLPVIVQSINESGGVDQAVQGACTMKITGRNILTQPGEDDEDYYALVVVTTPTSGIAPLDVALVINESGGQAISFLVDWGDGFVKSTTNHVDDHTYENPGVYTPTVRATLQGEQTAPFQSQTTVTVLSSDTYFASADVEPTDGIAPLDVTLTITETNGPADFFDVDWRDGSAVERILEPTATHTYLDEGTFVATVTPTIFDQVQGQISAPPVTVTLPAALIVGETTSDGAQADGTSTNAAKFAATDVNGDFVAVPLTITASSATAVVTPSSGTTDASTGTLDVTVTDTRGETVTLTAASLDVTGTTDINFETVPQVLAKIKGEATIDNAAADGESSAEATFTALDTNDAPMPGVDLTVTIDSETAQLATKAITTGDDGAASVTLTDTVAETVSVTAASDDISGSADVNFTSTGPAPVETINGTDGDSAPADGVSTSVVSFVALDADGAGIASTTLTITSDSGTALIDNPAQGVTDETGTVQVSVTDTSPETVTLTAASGDVTGTAQAVFTSVAPTLADIEGTDADGDTPPDGTTEASLVFTARGSDGAVMEGVDMTFAADSETAVLDPESGTSNANGVVRVKAADTVAELVTVTASSGDVSGNAAANFAEAAPTVDTISGTDAADDTPADGSTTATVSFLVSDGDGNPMAGVDLAISSNSADATLDPFMTGTTGDDGTLDVTITDTKVEQVTVTASVDSVSGTASANFVAPPATFASIAGTDAGDTPADGTTQAAIVFAAVGSDGKAWTDAVDMDFTCDSSTAVLDNDTGTTGADGTIAVNVTNTVVELVTITATSGEIGGTATANFVEATPTLQFIIGTNAASDTPADGVTQAAVKFTTYSDFGVTPLPNYPLTFRTNYSGQLDEDSGTTDENGEITVRATDTVAETITVTAETESGPQQGTAQATFVEVTPVYADSLDGKVTADIAPADGKSGDGITFTAYDADSAPLAGATLAITLDSESASATPASGVTGDDGTLDVSIINTVAEFVTVTATSGDATKDVKIEFASTAPVADIAATDADDTPADGVSFGTATFTATDADGNPLLGLDLGITADSDDAVLVYPDSMTTNIDGVVTVTVKDTTVELVTFTASRDDATATATCNFTALGPDVATINGTDAASDTAADGAAGALVSFLVSDSNGDPVEGVELSFSADSETAGLGKQREMTDSDGIAALNVTDTEVELVTVTATYGDVTGTATANFIAAGPVVTTITGTDANDTVPPDGATAGLVSFLASDGGGEPVGGIELTFSTDSETAALGAPSAYTDADTGIAQVNVTDTVAETVVVTATIGDVTGTASATFANDDPTALAKITGTDGSPKPANGSTAGYVTFTALDGTGAPMEGVDLDCTCDGSAVLGLPTATTGSDGTATVTASDGSVETVTITATSGGVTGTAKLQFYATQAASIEGTDATKTAPANGSNTVDMTFVALDENGDGVPYLMLTFTSDTGSAHFNGNVNGYQTQTQADGSVNVTVSDVVVGTTTVTATNGAVSGTAQATFTAQTFDHLQVLVATGIPADGSSLMDTTVYAFDTDGAKMSGIPVSITTSSETVSFVDATSGTIEGTMFTCHATDTVAEQVTMTATRTDDDTVTATNQGQFTAPS